MFYERINKDKSYISYRIIYKKKLIKKGFKLYKVSN
jgi:hypothetical protein